MTFTPPLTETQIAATLQRHGYPQDQPVIGIRRTGDQTTVNIEGAQLIVPPDVLADRGGTDEERRAPLFEHGAQ